MTATPTGHTGSGKRIAAIDVARGVALIAMAIYHFTWDLEFFGYAEPGLTAFGGWKLFARCIASSFLFLVGVSLWLAHRNGVRWPGFWKRWTMVAVAAALISAATYIATPESFIFFGILHQIALASLLGLVFLRLPALVILPVAVAVIALPYVYSSDAFNHPALWWTGLSSERARSNDFVPLFPWFGAVLIGMAAAKLADSAGIFAQLRELALPRWTRLLDFLGQHSLAFYLIHQPVLIGLVWLAAQIAPPQPIPLESRFSLECQRSCADQRSEAFCTRYCGCMLGELNANKTLDLSAGAPQTEATKQALEDMVMLCTFRTEDALPEERTE